MAPTTKRRRSAPPSSIPEEILVSDVLARLPVKSLLRFRSVCWSWRAANDDPRFVRRHLELSSARPPSVVDVPCEPRLEQYWTEARSSKDQPLEFRRIWPGGLGGEPTAELMHAVTCSITAVTHPVHCDGMVLVPTTSGELFLSNPATREFVRLPRGSPTTVFVENPVAFGFDPWSGTYKVARCFYRCFEMEESDDDGHVEVEYDVGHEVLMLGGTSPSWEETNDPPHAIMPTRPICTRGNFYWTAVVGRADEPRPMELLRFCLRDETFHVVPNPPCFVDTEIAGVIGDRDTLTELTGRLCCAHVCAQCFYVDIWLANDDGPCLDWYVAYNIELLRPVQHSVLPLAVIDGDDVLLSVDRNTLYRYKATTGTLHKVVDMQRAPDFYAAPKPPRNPFIFLHHAVPYVESLVSIQSSM
ncbi:hypothetical protein QOZ80_4AG0322110 [Eleusine coracana subsp. coracana]|nr:hypothetical protein QOZ80_4AG0322110 [Eleusine coracana subsp. coracana]